MLYITEDYCERKNEKGFKVYNLDKGILDWKELGKEISF